jgi:hypothetical protein
VSKHLKGADGLYIRLQKAIVSPEMRKQLYEGNNPMIDVTQEIHSMTTFKRNSAGLMKRIKKPAGRWS